MNTHDAVAESGELEERSRRGDVGDGRYAYEGLDRLLHEKARLGILTSLSSHPEGLLFNDLKRLCALTDGNLSRHIQVLSEAGLVEIWKGFEGKRPQTLCRLGPEGRRRFVEYVEILRRVVQDASAECAEESSPSLEESCRPLANPAPARTQRDPKLPPGWVPVSG
jgi:DNA-binding MarR family transcriptional regulator